MESETAVFKSENGNVVETLNVEILPESFIGRSVWEAAFYLSDNGWRPSSISPIGQDDLSATFSFVKEDPDKISRTIAELSRLTRSD